MKRFPQEIVHSVIVGIFDGESLFCQTLWWMVRVLFIDYGDVIFSKAWPDKQPISLTI